ncbi:23S rRNA (uracil(747)-C(5))-methyltransferase, partial [Arthrobacter deserti]|nr:23S rRNA (uracil(747)-C(5))-methyltransferase [Arthrobacter deserti]
MQCTYFEAARCRSCTQITRPYARQHAAKQQHCRALLARHTALQWLPPVESAEWGFRNKAKMVVGGTARNPTIGNLDSEGRGVDLSACGLCAPGLQDCFPVLAEFIRQAGLTPYDVPRRRGELKYLIVTESP